jgi:DNA polymerase III gamma/tau subunit
MDLDKHWHSSGDFRTAFVPSWFDEFWDYPRNRIYRNLERMVMNNTLPSFNIFAGPPGSGKTVAAYVLGCVSSCPKWDEVSHRPCGACDECRSVRLFKGDRWRRGFFEIDGADRSAGRRVIDEVYEAHNTTTGYRHSKGGDPARDFIVFIDEAQRLSPSDREALLKLVEKWCGAHIILATSHLDRLAVPAPEGTRNPLLSRATVFSFSYPTLDECASGILAAGKRARLDVDPEVAKWIARKCDCAPRDCLGELYILSNFGPTISMKNVEETHDEAATVPVDDPAIPTGDEPLIY